MSDVTRKRLLRRALEVYGMRNLRGNTFGVFHVFTVHF